MIPDGALPSRPSLSKRRSRRLRKKLRIAEFQQLGFAVAFALDGDGDQFWDEFITRCIVARGLSFGGGETGGYVVKSGRGSASDDDRQAVATWLQARSGMRDVQVGPLEDAWYAQGDSEGPYE